VAELTELLRPELVKLCEARGLPTYGTKAVLLARLTAGDGTAEAEADPFDEEPGDGAEPDGDAAGEPDGDEESETEPAPYDWRRSADDQATPTSGVFSVAVGSAATARGTRTGCRSGDLVGERR
jgi:hypothetical protein